MSIFCARNLVEPPYCLVLIAYSHWIASTHVFFILFAHKRTRKGVSVGERVKIRIFQLYIIIIFRHLLLLHGFERPKCAIVPSFAYLLLLYHLDQD